LRGDGDADLLGDLEDESIGHGDLLRICDAGGRLGPGQAARQW
jgi:hypothetical protein